VPAELSAIAADREVLRAPYRAAASETLRIGKAGMEINE